MLNIPEDITGRLKSRKFWIVIVYGFVALFLDELGIDVTREQLENVTYVVLAYLGFQGGMDAVGAFRSK